MDENHVSSIIIGAAIEVHRELGPGLLESVYFQCLARELALRRIPFATEVSLRANYKGLQLDTVYRMDLVVADRVVVELKVVESVLPVHKAQLLSYLRLSGKRLGLLVNFNATCLKDGVTRLVNKL